MLISNVLKCIQVKRAVRSNLKKHAVQDTQYISTVICKMSNWSNQRLQSYDRFTCL